MSRDFGAIIQIGDILVSEDVVSEYFCCNYEDCKGICCVEGDSGAPVLEEELEGLEAGYDKYQAEMSDEGRASVAHNGFFEIDREGDIVTPLVPNTCECAYCHKCPDGNLLCAIEKVGLKKPISCKLYPIRVTNLTGGGKALNVHHWGICKGAFAKGEREGIKVYQFLKAPLVECFGEDFYEALCAAAEHLEVLD